MQIKPKINVLRALSAVIARRVIRLFAIIVGAILAVTLFGVWVLAHFFSPWWWLLLIVYIPLFIASAFIYLIAMAIATSLYATPLSRDQRKHLLEFTDKITHLLETRGMNWWWFAALCMRDLLFYRELRTLKELLADAISLKADLTSLERELA